MLRERKMGRTAHAASTARSVSPMHGHDARHNPRNTMNSEQKKAAVRRYYDEAYSQGKYDVIDQVMHPEYQNHDPSTPGTTVRGPAAFKEFLQGYRRAFSDLT